MSMDYGAKVPRIQVDGFGFLPGDSREIIRRYTITNRNNAIVRLITLGAGIQSLIIPNKNYDMADVILGFDTVDGYLENRYVGRIVGRVFNSSQSKNSPKNSENENKNSKNPWNNFDIVNWDSYILGDQVVMTHVSRDINNSYPGDLLTQVKYTWTDDNKLHVNVCARSTKTTPVNITSHCYFNLAGHGMGSKELKNHIITANADRWIQQDIEKCNKPTGIIEKVEKTAFDLRFPTRMSSKKQYQVHGGGYDHHLCINNPCGPWWYRFHARVLHPGSNRVLEVYSNHPAMKLYTGNHFPNPDKMFPPDINDDNNDEIGSEKNRMEEKVIGKDGLSYTRHCCFAVIPQNYPEASDFKNFPGNILQPGQIYVHNITYDFGTGLNCRDPCTALRPECE